MKPSDLNTGMICTLRNGSEYIVMREFARFPSETCNLIRCDQILWNKDGLIYLSHYNDDFEYTASRPYIASDGSMMEKVDHSFDIMEVYLGLEFIEFYHKQDGQGKILWRREDESITTNKSQAGQFPCIYYAPGGYINPETPVKPRSAHAVLVYIRQYYIKTGNSVSIEAICEDLIIEESTVRLYIEELTKAHYICRNSRYEDTYWPVHWLRQLPLEAK